MATPREKEVADYLEKHKIIELFDNLTSMLFFHRPEDPKEFLIEKLEQLRSSKQRRVPGPSLFDGSNVDALFGILDPGNQGHITFAQYKEALMALGVRDIKECPEGVNEDRISRETFEREATEGLHRCSTTYEQS